MSKQKTTYNCTNCSYQTVKWLGNCPECKSWNTFEQATFAKHMPTSRATVSLTDLTAITTKPIERMLSGIKEWDRVTGGGIVPGAFLVVTGDPGIGKSTLLL